jgi:hypothetical protein
MQSEDWIPAQKRRGNDEYVPNDVDSILRLFILCANLRNLRIQEFFACIP